LAVLRCGPIRSDPILLCVPIPLRFSGVKTDFGGHRSTGFALIYDTHEDALDVEPKYRLIRVRNRLSCTVLCRATRRPPFCDSDSDSDARNRLCRPPHPASELNHRNGSPSLTVIGSGVSRERADGSFASDRVTSIIAHDLNRLQSDPMQRAADCVAVLAAD
jgi:hypothetical protein